MKKIKIVVMAVVLLFVTGCANKIPFKSSLPLENASLVYIYLPNYSETVEDISNQNYRVRINDKSVEGRIKSNEYMAFNLKPQTIKFSATRANIEEKIANLDLKVGGVYYLRIRDNLQDGSFSFEPVSKEIGEKEIVKTELSGSVLEDKKKILTELVGIPEVKKEETKTQISISTTDELEKAYGLKEKGIITDEEFKALKSKIISK